MLHELDEQKAAQQSLAESEAHITSLCAQHVDLFVSIQRRSDHVLQTLQDLVDTVDDAVQDSQVKTVVNKDEDEEGGMVTGCVIDVSPMHMAVELERQGEALNKLAEKHKMRRRTLLQHSSLLQLLEIPSLMDACVRCKMYDECLSLASLANALERSHSLGKTGVTSNGVDVKNTDVIISVVKDVRRKEDDLRRHLISRLRGGNSNNDQAHLSLPQCLEVVTALRRLNGIEIDRKHNSSKKAVSSRDEVERNHDLMELRLQVDFLEARDTWLESSVIKPTTTSDSKMLDPTATKRTTEPLLDLIEVYRTRCFEIATQFFAIFQSSKVKGNGNSNISLLSLWISRRVESFLSRLEEGLATVNDTGSLRDILDATVFFASSIGRVGADFQSLLPPLFDSKLVDIVIGHWARGLESLSNSLLICRDAGVATPLFNDKATFDESTADESIDDVSLIVPRYLLSFPPLSRLTNSFLIGLNELRRCLLRGVFSTLKEKLDNFLKDIDTVLQINQKLVMTPGLRGDAKTLREMSAKYRDLFENTIKRFFLVALDYALGYEIDLSNQSFVKKNQEALDQAPEEDTDAGKEELDGKNKEEVVTTQEVETTFNVNQGHNFISDKDNQSEGQQD